MEAWKQDKRHKPLILRGARQVGKTTVVNEFGAQFDNYLYFNLERSESIKLFEMEIPLDDLVNMLYASVGKAKKEIIGSTEMVDSWRGHIAEQITAQELLALEDRVGQHRSFWAKPNNGAEVDFVFVHESKLYPIEVKSGTNAHLRSLQVFSRIGLKITLVGFL